MIVKKSNLVREKGKIKGISEDFTGALNKTAGATKETAVANKYTADASITEIDSRCQT